jgi:hypothetical protein
MTLSPRDRADYLLLIEKPTNRQCLEAFATESGVELCRQFANIVTKASTELPELKIILELPAELVAIQVGVFLDGCRVPIDTSEPVTIDGLFD